MALNFEVIRSLSSFSFWFYSFRFSISFLLSAADLSSFEVRPPPMVLMPPRVISEKPEVLVAMPNFWDRSLTFAFSFSMVWALPFQEFSSDKTLSTLKFSPISLVMTLWALFNSFLRFWFVTLNSYNFLSVCWNFFCQSVSACEWPSKLASLGTWLFPIVFLEPVFNL